MKLRHPLLLMSLLTLSLPWAGCKYIQQVEDTLRQGQGLGLSSTAQAVAARIESEPKLLDHPHHSSQFDTHLIQTHSLNQALYVHALPSPPTLLDGYEDDWLPWGFEKIQFKDASRKEWALELVGGIHADDLYLFLKINDNDIRHHNPMEHKLASGDYILLSGRHKQSLTQYVIATSAPGNISARYTNSENQIQTEYRIQGSLREHYRGYQLELKVPLSLVSEGFGIAAIDRRKNKKDLESIHHSLGTITPQSPEAPPLILPLPHLVKTLNVFERPGLQLRIVSPEGWLLANGAKPDLALPLPEDKTPWMMEWIYKQALTHEPLPTRGFPEKTGFWSFKEIDHAAQGQINIQWYQQGEQRLGSAAVPIWKEDNIVAIVLAEQSV